MVSVTALVPLHFSIAIATVFQGLKHPEVFIQTEDKIKYKGSTLNPNDIDRHIERLEECMSNDKPYFNPGLNLVKLSQKLSIQPRHLSQTLNASLNQTFIDFINASLTDLRSFFNLTIHFD